MLIHQDLLSQPRQPVSVSICQVHSFVYVNRCPGLQSALKERRKVDSYSLSPIWQEREVGLSHVVRERKLIQFLSFPSSFFPCTVSMLFSTSFPKLTMLFISLSLSRFQLLFNRVFCSLPSSSTNDTSRQKPCYKLVFHSLFILVSLFLTHLADKSR